MLFWRYTDVMLRLWLSAKAAKNL